jgi:hypothetical protein
MPNNYVLLEKITVGAAGAASVTFANIPQTGYTDLVVKATVRSARTTGGTDGLRMEINGAATNRTYRSVGGSGAAAYSENDTTTFVGYLPQNGGTTGWTANTFTNTEIYIPNYTSSNNKSISVDTTTENNATTSYADLLASLWSQTAPIASLTFKTGSGSDLVANSTFYLYGVAKLGTTPAIAPKATGGDIIDTDGTYWYHTFLSSGTFTPAVALTTDYLVVAGGGGGGGDSRGGGGGAGGLRSTVTATGGGGSLESAISLATNTSYTVTVGAGGAGAGADGTGASGNNSVFSTITSTGGGGGGEGGVGGATRNGVSGGSGGGGGGYSIGAGGAGTANQGFAGGTGSTNPFFGGAGGGGAGAVGANATTDNGAAGGNGITTLISGTSRTYAGGGGGGTTATGGAGGSGGGGAGINGGTPNPGTPNTGSGGGGGQTGGAGGSGIVIIRYAVA